MTVVVFHAIKLVGSVLSIYSPNIEIFMVSRFIVAVGSTASNLATFVIGNFSFSHLFAWQPSCSALDS